MAYFIKLKYLGIVRPKRTGSREGHGILKGEAGAVSVGGLK
jgi:hypothetical protein